MDQEIVNNLNTVMVQNLFIITGNIIAEGEECGTDVPKYLVETLDIIQKISLEILKGNAIDIRLREDFKENLSKFFTYNLIDSIEENLKGIKERNLTLASIGDLLEVYTKLGKV